MVVTIDPAAVCAQVDDGAVLLNVDTGIYYGLDQVGSRVWEIIGAGATDDSLVDQLSQEYSVDRETLRFDVATLLSELQAKGLVRIAAA
jgi:hypothetical protein